MSPTEGYAIAHQAHMGFPATARLGLSTLHHVQRRAVDVCELSPVVDESSRRLGQELMWPGSPP
jgi:hypothetical protein